MPRTQVFVSYSHKGARWLDERHVHLAPLESESDLWDDTRVAADARWRDEIEAAPRSTKLAVGAGAGLHAPARGRAGTRGRGRAACQDERTRKPRTPGDELGASSCATSCSITRCRTRAYQGGAQLGAAFTRRTLVDFGPEQIRAFATQRSRAIYRVPPGEDGTPDARRAAAHGAQLVGAIEAHPHVRPLTSNPLLLTILAVVRWNERKRPEQRAELCEAVVKYLLETRKTLGRRESAEVVAPLLGVELSRGLHRGRRAAQRHPQ